MKVLQTFTLFSFGSAGGGGGHREPCYQNPKPQTSNPRIPLFLPSLSSSTLLTRLWFARQAAAVDAALAAAKHFEEERCPKP